MEKDKNHKNSDDEEVDKILKQNSGGYGYWKREGDLEGLDQKKPVVSNTNTLESKVSAGSAWNTAGTWEEKHYNKQQIESFFNSKLTSFKHNELSIDKINGYSGDTYTFIVRQKPKLVYDCELKLTIKNETEEVEVELTDVNNHETDSTFEFSFKGGNKELIASVKKSKKEIESFIKELFMQFWESQKK